MSEISHYPAFGAILPNGHLRIPTAGITPEGERWDGFEDVGPEHPDYDRWLIMITHKEQHLEAMAEETRQSREERRRRTKEKG